jgi:hypothetical protein
MSTVVVKYRLRNGHVLSVDEFNENLYDLAVELDGKLSEHNFVFEAFPYPDVVDVVSIYGWGVAGETCDPFFDWHDNMRYKKQYFDVHNLEDTTWGQNYVGTPAENTVAGNWEPVEGMSRTLQVSHTGWLWVIASFQHDHETDNAGSATPDQVPYTWFGGALYGIRLNGQLIQESVLGGLDWANDAVRTTRTGIHSVQSSAGILWPAMPLVCDALVEIPPGSHKIELVVYAHVGTSEKIMWVSNRELIILRIGR